MQDGTVAAGIFMHKLLSDSVGHSVAAFAECAGFCRFDLRCPSHCCGRNHCQPPSEAGPAGVQDCTPAWPWLNAVHIDAIAAYCTLRLHEYSAFRTRADATFHTAMVTQSGVLPQGHAGGSDAAWRMVPRGARCKCCSLQVSYRLSASLVGAMQSEECQIISTRRVKDRFSGARGDRRPARAVAARVKGLPTL